MNRPSPSLAILAIIAVILALVFLWREYLSPSHHSAGALGRAAVQGYQGSRMAALAPCSGDGGDPDVAAAEVDAGFMWARSNNPMTVAGCPTFSAEFRTECGLRFEPTLLADAVDVHSGPSTVLTTVHSGQETAEAEFATILDLFLVSYAQITAADFTGATGIPSPVATGLG